MRRLRESENQPDTTILGHKISYMTNSVEFPDQQNSIMTTDSRQRVNKNVDYFKEYMKQTDLEIQSVPNETHAEIKNEDLESNTSQKEQPTRKLLIPSTNKRTR